MPKTIKQKQKVIQKVSININTRSKRVTRKKKKINNTKKVTSDQSNKSNVFNTSNFKGRGGYLSPYIIQSLEQQAIHSDPTNVAYTNRVIKLSPSIVATPSVSASVAASVLPNPSVVPVSASVVPNPSILSHSVVSSPSGTSEIKRIMSSIIDEVIPKPLDVSSHSGVSLSSRRSKVKNNDTKTSMSNIIESVLPLERFPTPLISSNRSIFDISKVFGSSESLPEQEKEQEPEPQPEQEPEQQIPSPRSIYDMSRVFGSDDKHSQRPILREPLPEQEPEKQEQEEKEQIQEPEPQQEPVQILSNIDEVAANISKDEKTNYIEDEFVKRGLLIPSNLGRNYLRKYVIINGKKKRSVNLNDIYISMKEDTFDWNLYNEDLSKKITL